MDSVIECKVALSDNCQRICMILHNPCIVVFNECMCACTCLFVYQSDVLDVNLITRLVSSVVNIILYNSILYKLKTRTQHY